MLPESPGKNQDKRTMSYSDKKPLRKQKAYATEEDTDNEGEEIVGLVTEHAFFANRRSNWVVDSGAPCHMYNDDLLNQIIVLKAPQEKKVGDDTLFKVELF